MTSSAIKRILECTGRGLRFFAAISCWVVAAVGLTFLAGGALWLAALLIVAFAVVWWRVRQPWWMAGSALLACLITVVAVSQREARNDRDWWTELSVLPEIDLNGNVATMRGVRNFQWRDVDEFDAKWESRTVDLSQLTDLELVVEPFGPWDLLAHTMLCFGFADGQRIAVSIEARKEQGENFGLLAGACREFELIYIIGDERDFLTLRAICRGSRLFAFPVKCDLAFRQRLFRDLAAAANALHTQPQFYTSLYQNCTTTIVKHVDELQPHQRIGLASGTIFPGLAGEFLYDIERLDGDFSSHEDAYQRCRIDPQIRENADKHGAEFSRAIRGH